MLVLPGTDFRLQSGLQHGIPNQGQGQAHILNIHEAQQIRGSHACQLGAPQRASHRDSLVWVAVASRGGHQRVRYYGRVALDQLRPRWARATPTALAK